MVPNLVIMLMAMSVDVSFITVTSAAGVANRKKSREWTQEDLNLQEELNKKRRKYKYDPNYIPKDMTYPNDAPSLVSFYDDGSKRPEYGLPSADGKIGPAHYKTDLNDMTYAENAPALQQVYNEKLQKNIFVLSSDGSASRPVNSNPRLGSSKQSGKQAAATGSSSRKQTAGFQSFRSPVGSIGFGESFAASGSGPAMAASSHYGGSSSFPLNSQGVYYPAGYGSSQGGSYSRGSGSSTFSPPRTNREATADLISGIGRPKPKTGRENSRELDLELRL